MGNNLNKRYLINLKEQKMFTQTKKQPCAVSMTDLGISTVILTDKEGIEKVLYEYEAAPDHVWCDGRGKRYMYLMLKQALQSKDAHFNKHPELINQSNQDWVDFCDDCLLLYALDAFLYEKPIMLIHPESYAQQLQSTKYDATGGDMPKLIEGIPIVQ